MAKFASNSQSRPCEGRLPRTTPQPHHAARRVQGRTLGLCLWFLLAVAVLLPNTGCQLTRKTTFAAHLPSHHTVSTRHFVIHSDIQINAGDPIVKELESLQETVRSTLNLPEQRDPVVVYLFTDEVTYRFYMQSTWKDLPARRAYFVGTPRELAVYSFRSPHLQADLRHEFTHGILHACLGEVPLWLDEGLAEYFELRGGETGEPHPMHVAELRRALDEGWNPSLYKLEVTTDFRNLTQRDYAEAWAWVHFMLHTRPEAKQALLDYIASLSKTSTPTRIQPSLEKALPEYFPVARAHMEKLQATPSTVQLP